MMKKYSKPYFQDAFQCQDNSWVEDIFAQYALQWDGMVGVFCVIISRNMLGNNMQNVSNFIVSCCYKTSHKWILWWV